MNYKNPTDNNIDKHWMNTKKMCRMMHQICPRFQSNIVSKWNQWRISHDWDLLWRERERYEQHNKCRLRSNPSLTLPIRENWMDHHIRWIQNINKNLIHSILRWTLNTSIYTSTFCSLGEKYYREKNKRFEKKHFYQMKIIRRSRRLFFSIFI